MSVDLEPGFAMNRELGKVVVDWSRESLHLRFTTSCVHLIEVSDYHQNKTCKAAEKYRARSYQLEMFKESLKMSGVRAFMLVVL
jgi:hypothetical protein